MLDYIMVVTIKAEVMRVLAVDLLAVLQLLLTLGLSSAEHKPLVIVLV